MTAVWRRLDWSAVGGTLVIGGAVLDSFTAVSYVNDGTMKPLIDVEAHSIDRCVVFGIRKHWSDYVKDDIVIIKNPTTSTGSFTRRLVGLQHQWVRRDEKSSSTMHVPEGHCAVFQDNYETDTAPLDSSTFGPIPLRMVEGKVKAIVWPISMWKIIE